MGRNQYWARRVYDLCVYYMTGTPEGSTKSGFMEKPGIEPATPGLQGIALIHYTTGPDALAVGSPVGFLLLRYYVLCTVESLSLLYPLLFLNSYVLGDDELRVWLAP